MNGRSDRWLAAGVCLLLVAAVWAIYGQTLGYGFVNFDDDEYVYENSQVVHGLTWSGAVWAFTHVHSANWHPLTWLSHMLDCQLYGLTPGGHHVTSVLLHAATAILLFLVLRQMTGALWRSAFVAAVFALHPLRVESVAWIAERKDVLSGLFFMLTLGAYVRYVQRPWSPVRYLMVALLLALALMAKPMVVTLPFVLLLLDYWPLKRFAHWGGGVSALRLALEKIPLLLLCAASCAATLFAQKEAIAPLPLPARLANVPVAYMAYLREMFFPVDLIAFYTHSDLRLGAIVSATILLLAISAAAVFLHKKQPWVMVGWFWYLGMLVPVIGVLQVGSQAHADRYTYLPQIGLYLLLAWSVSEFCAGWRGRRLLLGGAAAAVLGALLLLARAQTSVWRDSRSLWTHALACDSDNPVAHNNLGSALLQAGLVDEALAHQQRALKIQPDYPDAHINLGNALLRKGQINEAIGHYEVALRISPRDAGTHFNLGNALLKHGAADEAIRQYEQALEINPEYAEAHSNLGNTLFQKGRPDEAIAHYRRALEIRPGYAKAQNNLGFALLSQGRLDEAIRQLTRALELQPDDPETHFNLGNAFARKRNVGQALAHYQTANQLTKGNNPPILIQLAAAYAQAGQIDQAIRTTEEAISRAQAAGRSDIAEKLRDRLKLLRNDRPAP